MLLASLVEQVGPVPMYLSETPCYHGCRKMIATGGARGGGGGGGKSLYIATCDVENYDTITKKNRSV